MVTLPASRSGARLTGDVLPATTDVVVIGAGIAGACAAYHLARQGLSVLIAEAGRVGCGTTACAVGVLTPPLRPPYPQMVSDLGAEQARRVWELGVRSVEGLCDLIQATGEGPGTDLDWSGGFVLAEEHNELMVRSSCETMRQAGLPVRALTSPDALEHTGSEAFPGGFHVAAGGAVDPELATAAVIRAAVAVGGRIAERTTVLEVIPELGGFRTITARGEVSSAAVVHATHLGRREFREARGMATIAVRAQAFVTAPIDRHFHGFFATQGKTNVWRQRSDGRLVVSGWRHYALPRAYGRSEGEIDPSLQAELRSWFEAAFPELGRLRIEEEWSGSFAWSSDFLPLAGALPDRAGEWITLGLGDGGLGWAFECGRVVAHGVVDATPVEGSDLVDPRRAPSHELSGWTARAWA